MSNAKPPAQARPTLTYQEMLNRDSREVPAHMRLESPGDFGVEDIPAEIYWSLETQAAEKANIWSRCWQVACREEVIPEVGDTDVFTVAGMSAIIVRTGPDEIRAYPNACLHRGRELRDGPGRVRDIQCAFHGFCWNLDGSLKRVPAAWDFPQVAERNFDLQALPVGRWGGFVFISFDRHVEPFEQYLGDLPAHFENWALQDWYTEAHIEWEIECNWKVAQEAFMESYHLVTTHPQLLPGSADGATQYDVFGNFSRAMQPNCVPSPHLNWQPSEQEMLDALLDRTLGEEPMVVVPEGSTARTVFAEVRRQSFRPAMGDDVEKISDAEMIDSIYYSLFPNLHPWGGYGMRYVYRFRPHGDDPNRCLFDTWILTPFRGERPSPARTRKVGPDERIVDVEDIGVLARVYEQDSYNMPAVQRGLKTMTLTKPGVTLSAYQESKIRHFHHLYRQHMGGE